MENSVPTDANRLLLRIVELEREAAQQMILHSQTANQYLQRLHSQFAESLLLEATMLRQQQEFIAERSRLGGLRRKGNQSADTADLDSPRGRRERG